MANQNQNGNHNIPNGLEEAKVPVAVVMVPLTAQGHLNQLLHLSRLISAYDMPIHFVSTTAHIRQAKARVHGWDPLAVPNMHFHELPTPPYDNPSPDPSSTNKFPVQIIPMLKSLPKLREPLYALLQEIYLEARKIVVIYDSLMAYVVQDVRSIPDAEAYCFQSIGAFSFYAFYWEAMGKPTIGLPSEAEMALRQVPSSEGCFVPEFFEISRVVEDTPLFKSGDLYNTNRVIEGLYLDLFAKQKLTGVEKLWAVGPFNPVSLPDYEKEGRNGILKWLDEQEENSVVFVSFGTTSSISDEQIREIAMGLEKSEQRFIWVLREADRGNALDGEVMRRAQLPDGYEERVEGRGIVVREWAPQLEILGHVSTGGFISHCGWNSCIESISMGKPIGTWPMHSDQPKNAVLITKVLRTGVEVRDWDRRDEVLSSIEVEKAVRKLMASVEADELRQRAAGLGDAVKKSVMEGGASRIEMDSFIHHITR